MKILTFSSLYPNSVDPSHGIFVERRLRKLTEATDISASVVAPVPWFPVQSPVFGKYGRFAAVPRNERRYGIEIDHPRFLVIPKVGMAFVPRWMARSSRATVTKYVAETHGANSLLDAHYFYPDGVAASLLSGELGIPFIVTARGSDINLIASMPGPRSMILEAAHKARAVVAVSHALATKMASLGIAEKKIHVLPNGVDTNLFQPGDRASARKNLRFHGTTFLSVGALKEAKGHDIAIKAMLHIPEATLVIVGSGEYERALKRLVARCGLVDRVRFAGTLDENRLVEYYQAADALLLISRREGMPNVVLESLACGTPVIATDVGGIREVVNSTALGILLQERNPECVAEAWSAIEQNGIDRAVIRNTAKSLSWDESIVRLHRLMHACCGTSAH